MTYVFILKCQFPDGRIGHYVWQTSHATSRKDGEKWVESEFASCEIGGPGMKKLGVKLLEIIDGGQKTCSTYDESMELHDAACKRAAKLDGKTIKKVVEPEKAEAA